MASVTTILIGTFVIWGWLGVSNAAPKELVLKVEVHYASAEATQVERVTNAVSDEFKKLSPDDFDIEVRFDKKEHAAALSYEQVGGLIGSAGKERKLLLFYYTGSQTASLNFCADAANRVQFAIVGLENTHEKSVQRAIHAIAPVFGIRSDERGDDQPSCFAPIKANEDYGYGGYRKTMSDIPSTKSTKALVWSDCSAKDLAAAYSKGKLGCLNKYT